MPVEIIDILKPKNNGDFPVADAEDIAYDETTKVKAKIDAKQDKLVSGTNIKSVNGQSLLGAGNIEIESGSSFEIPTITLIPTSADPISGTLSDEDYTTIQNNNIIKFVVPNTVDTIVSKQVVQGMFMFFFLLGDTIYNLLIESNKSFSILQTQLPLGMRILGNNLGVYDTTSNLMGGTVSKTQMQEWLEIGGGGSSANVVDIGTVENFELTSEQKAQITNAVSQNQDIVLKAKMTSGVLAIDTVFSHYIENDTSIIFDGTFICDLSSISFGYIAGCATIDILKSGSSNIIEPKIYASTPINISLGLQVISNNPTFELTSEQLVMIFSTSMIIPDLKFNFSTDNIETELIYLISRCSLTKKDDSGFFVYWLDIPANSTNGKYTCTLRKKYLEKYTISVADGTLTIKENY